MQIVVFVLDSSPSMNKAYPSGGCKTRLGVAKEALQNMLFDLIIDSHYNKANVVVCKTEYTDHHMFSDRMMPTEQDGDLQHDDEVPFPNVTALCDRIEKPSSALFKRVSQVQSTLTMEESDMAGGDVIDGIMVAADALYQETRSNKTAQRKIIVLTDADHDFVVDEWQSNQLVVSLISLECRLEVIGLDFETSADFVSCPAAVLSETKLRCESSPGKAGNQTTYSDKHARENALARIAEQTGGRIIAASTLQEVLEARKGLKATHASLKKCMLIIAPGLEVDVKYMPMSRKFDLPRMEQKVKLDSVDSERQLESLVDPVVRTYDYTLETDAGKPSMALIDVDDTVKAYPYNTSNVETNEYDEQLILTKMGLMGSYVRIEILGYMDRTRVPNHYMLGPPTLITGEMSRKACATVAAMAQALASVDKVALCMFYKRKDKTGYFGGLFPLTKSSTPTEKHLVFMALPHAGDVQDLSRDIFPLDELVDDGLDNDAAASVDSLIDSLMVTDKSCAPGLLPNPLTRSWYQTLMKRMVDPTCEPVRWRDDQQVDPLSTHPDTLKAAKKALHAFRSSFPLKDIVKVSKEASEQIKRNKGKHKVHNFEDHLNLT